MVLYPNSLFRRTVVTIPNLGMLVISSLSYKSVLSTGQVLKVQGEEVEVLVLNCLISSLIFFLEILNYKNSFICIIKYITPLTLNHPIV